MHETRFVTEQPSELRPLSTPRAELTRLQEEQEQGRPEVRREIMEAALLCSGEIGFRRLPVERVYRHYGGYRSQFYKFFRNKTDCFVAAYDWKATQVADHVVDVLRADEALDQRLRRILDAMAAQIEEQEALAKALIIEVHVAGREASLKRKAIMERLYLALDEACRGSKASAPPLTAEFLVNAIDQAAASAILAGRPADFADAVPDLVVLILQAYQHSA